MTTKPRPPLTARTAARRAALFAAEKQAQDIIVLDLRKVTDFTDYFVICTGSVDVHVRAIQDAIESGLRNIGWRPKHIEGSETCRWALLDYIDIVVHVFQPEARRFYAVERLWGDAPLVEIKGLTK
ncbi:MAG: ribosome silencing factor [Calditrichota bacterium]